MRELQEKDSDIGAVLHAKEVVKKPDSKMQNLQGRETRRLLQLWEQLAIRTVSQVGGQQQLEVQIPIDCTQGLTPRDTTGATRRRRWRPSWGS